jgi:predicted small lipoprotein YifL
MRMTARRTSGARTRSLLLAATLTLCACGSRGAPFQLPDADTRLFFEQAYPVLLTDCGFPACHGTPERFFVVYGPGRTRLDPATDIMAEVTAEELALSYTRARSLLVAPGGPSQSLLLRKPLAVSAGGAVHAGNDPWGNAVIPNKRDARYETLFFWASGLRSDEVAP